MKAIGLAAVILTLVLLAGPAFSYVRAIPFQEGRAGVSGTFGLVETFHRSTPSTGRAEVRAFAVGYGGGHVFASIGPLYPVNSGPTLTESYSTTATFSGHVKGAFACGGGGPGAASAVLALRTQLWYNTGSSWSFITEREVQRYECLFLDSVDEDFTRSMDVTFVPGTEYRLLLEGHAIVAAEASLTASAQFSENLNERGVFLTSVTVPNQAPRAFFYNASQSIVNQYLYGMDVRGVACDYDGQIVRVEMHGGWEDGAPVLASRTGSGACLDVVYHFQSLDSLPLGNLGFSQIRVCGYDNERSRGCFNGTVRFYSGLGLPIIG